MHTYASHGIQQDLHPASRSTLDYCLVFAGLLVGFNLLRTLPGPSDRDDGNPIFQAITFAIYLPAISILVANYGAVAQRVLRKSWPLIGLIVLTLISIVWSDAPSTTLRRSIALILTTGFTLYIALRFSFDEFARILSFSAITFIVCSLIAAAIPGVGIASDGAWKGFAAIKNDFGRQTAIVLIMAVLLVMYSKDYKRTWVAIGACIFPLLLLSQSATSLLAAIGAIAGAMLLRFLFQPRLGRFVIGRDIRVRPRSGSCSHQSSWKQLAGI
jgi:O-antigen ligase